MAKKIVMFIDAEYIKDNTPIEQNVDDSLINTQIRKAQRLYVENALGTTFYESLKEKMVANTLSTIEEELIRDYIQPMLNEYTLYCLIPIIGRKFTNKSVSEKNSEFSTPSVLEDLKYIRNGVLDEAEFFNERLVKYLIQNYELFPEYYNSSCENLPASTQSYFSGIQMKKKRDCNKFRR